MLIYFAAEREPSLLFAGVVAVTMIGAAWLARRRIIAGPALMGIAALVAGFALAAARTSAVENTALAKPVRAEVIGTVDRVERRPRGYRLWITVERMTGNIDELPKRMRIVVARKGSEPPIGALVKLKGLWRPPPGPVRPGGYDWAREAYFMKIGGVGVADGPPDIVNPAPQKSLERWWQAAISDTRSNIADRITSVIPGATGAIAVSLVVGERGPIPEAINEAMRISGLTHVLSISGLHMALFAGAIFWAVRILLASIGPVALRHAIKKWSAVAAAFAAYGYLLLSGADVAAQRSFLMALVSFVAIACNRVAISARSIALAALALLLLKPEVVQSISFQMSFAAVLALVALYEMWRERPPSAEISSSKIKRFILVSLGGMIVTTIVAGLATAPFGAYYFQRTGIYSVLANLLALPIVGAIIMPAAVAGLALLPFGLDAPAWILMGWGIDGMTAVARHVAHLPYAAWHSHAFGPAAFTLMVFALTWVCLWRTVLRWLAVVPLTIGLAVAGTTEPPDVYIEPEGRAMAVRHTDGRLRIAGIRFARFAADSWLSADGDERRNTDRSVSSDVLCDRFACRLTLPNGRAATLAWTYHALNRDCGRSALIVTRLVAPPGCRSTATVVDAKDLAERGAISLKLRDGKFEMQSVRQPREERPWFNRPSLRGPNFPVEQQLEITEDPSVDPGDEDYVEADDERK